MVATKKVRNNLQLLKQPPANMRYAQKGEGLQNCIHLNQDLLFHFKAYHRIFPFILIYFEVLQPW